MCGLILTVTWHAEGGEAPAKASPFQFALYLIDVCSNLSDIYIMTLFKTDCQLKRYIPAASQVSDSQGTKPL